MAVIIKHLSMYIIVCSTGGQEEEEVISRQAQEAQEAEREHLQRLRRRDAGPITCTDSQQTASNKVTKGESIVSNADSWDFNALVLKETSYF